MQRISEPLTAVLRRTVYIGFGVQILLGVVWMCFAFASLSGFGAGVACLCRIVLACVAVFFFLGSLGIREIFQRVYGSLGILTFPMVMHCHMTAWRQSVTASLLLLVIGAAMRAAGRPGKRSFRRAGFWIALTVLCGLLAGMGNVYRKGQNFTICLTSRIAWSTLAENYEKWPQMFRDRVSQSAVEQCGFEADGIREVMLPYLDKIVEREATYWFMRTISSIAWQESAPVILREICWDAAGYAASPVIVPLQLEGRGYDSYSGLNYRQILGSNPKLGKWYLDYGCWWFKAGLGLSAALFIFGHRKISVAKIALAVLPGCMLILVCTMSGAGQMDYKNTVYVICIWLAGMLAAAFGGKAGA